MNMEISEDLSRSSSNDQLILKRKRTKRLRSSSSASSINAAASAGDFNYNSVLNSSSSPTSSSGISTSTDEDDDMAASCLILLARGGGFTEDQIRPEQIKFSGRRFTEMATTTNGKAGIYVYHCKTCNRTFPSFQALGGHRASHKKPKLAAESDRKKSPAPPPDYQKVEDAPPPTAAQFSGGNCVKVHECSICGSEFASGQALGGHMRRHRSVITNNINGGVGDLKSGNVLELDLNLPAPPEDDLDRRRSLVFSAAALVDCHY